MEIVICIHTKYVLKVPLDSTEARGGIKICEQICKLETVKVKSSIQHSTDIVDYLAEVRATNLATYFYGGHHYHHAMNPLTRVVKQKLV